MTPRRSPLARLAAGLLGAAALALLVLDGRAAAAPRAKPVIGHLTSRQVTGPACASPIGLCTAGRLTGGDQGAFEFAAARVAPSDVPGVLLYTGRLVVHTREGDLACTDAGAFNTAGDGEVVDLCEVTGGTGQLSGATGYLRVFGTFTPAAGGDSDYRGVLRLP
jgi:hypothetical protein